MSRTAKKKTYFDVWNKDLRRFDNRLYNGHVFEVEGIILNLFQVGTLCAMLGRSDESIRSWEKQGLFPEHKFNVQLGRGYDRSEQCRWYSEAQLRMVQNHAKTYWGLDFTKAKSPLVGDKKAFFTAVKHDWLLDFR